MFTPHKAIALIAATEARHAVHGRLVQSFGGLFALLALGVAVAGLGASGQFLIQGFTRTAISVLTLALYLLPLLGLVMGATAFGTEDGGLELLLAQPVARTDVVLGRALGLGAAMVAVGLGGFGLAGAVVATVSGAQGMAAYAFVAGAGTAVGLAGLALGALLGVLARRRAAAVGAALAAWLVIAILYDFAAIAAIQLTGNGDPGPLLLALLAANPVDGVRAVALVTLGADVLLGPTGSAMQQLMNDGKGAVIVGASLVLWCVGPVAGVCAVYRKRDF